MTIRPATLADLPALLNMSARFIDEYNAQTGAQLPMNAKAVEGTLRHLMAQYNVVVGGFAYVAVNDGDFPVGMLLGTHYTNPVTGERTASELALWIEPWARGGHLWLMLLDAFIQWSKDIGASVVQMAGIGRKRSMGRLYEKRGFRETETTYQRRVA